MMRCLLLTLPIVQIFASRFIVTPKIYYTIQLLLNSQARIHNDYLISEMLSLKHFLPYLVICLLLVYVESDDSTEDVTKDHVSKYLTNNKILGEGLAPEKCSEKVKDSFLPRARDAFASHLALILFLSSASLGADMGVILLLNEAIF